MVSPLPCCDVMMCSKCPLLIPGMRCRLSGLGLPRPFLQKAYSVAGKQQLIQETTVRMSFKNVVKHFVLTL